jgi:hypothetical protein
VRDDLPALLGIRRAFGARESAGVDSAHHRLAAESIRAGTQKRRLSTAAVLNETLSAPARSTSRISSTLCTPPPTVNGTKAREAVRRTTSSIVPRRS